MFDFLSSLFYGITMFIGGVMAFPIPFLIVAVMMALSSTALYAIIKRVLRQFRAS